MKLIIELTQEEVNAHTLSLIERLFKSTGTTTDTDNSRNCKTDTGAKVDNSRNTIMSDPYSLEDILPEPISTTKPKQDNADRLKEFAKKIESTLNDKDKRALEKFVNFYLPKIDNWKSDVNIQNLWSKWISSERK